MSEIEINIGNLRKCDNGIIRLALNDNVDIQERDIYELSEANQKLAEEERYSLLVVSGKYSTVTPEARELAASESFSTRRIALAFVTDDLAQRLLVNFFIKFNKPNTPTKLFSNEDDAKKWLLKSSKTKGLLSVF